MWREASSGSKAPARQGGGERDRLVAVVDAGDLAQLAGQAVQLAPVVGHLDPVADREARDARRGRAGVTVSFVRAASIPVTVEAIEPLSRDHLNVAVPERARRRGSRRGRGGSPGRGSRRRAAIVHGSSCRPGRRRRSSSGGRPTARSARPTAAISESQVVALGASSRRTCQAVCRRVAVSTAIAFSTRSGSSRQRDLALPDVEVGEVRAGRRQRRERRRRREVRLLS